MNTIILNKRTMSPSNILNNVVEGDIKLLKKAQKYFKAACRSVVGYKQLASYLSVSIIVVSSYSLKDLERKYKLPIYYCW